MNKFYRVVWNTSRKTWMVVGEIAKSQGKSKSAGSASSNMGIFQARVFQASVFQNSCHLIAGSLLLIPTTLLANGLPSGGLPSGESVVAGDGTISQSGNQMTIVQNSDKLAINWQQFSIAEGNTVEFVQPTADSAALNRVLGSQVSTIQGALKANGQVFLINPNGILFGNNAQVDVGGLVASTLDISPEDFMAGNLTFEGASSNAIINQGNIRTAEGGYVAMIAAEIINSGNIETPRGDTLMGAGSRVTLDMGGPVKIEVEEALLDTYIAQGGVIKADGGLVYLTAKAAGDLASSVINHNGTTEAHTLNTDENGEIWLLGDMKNGDVNVAGNLKADFVETSAATVTINKDLKVETNGGEWLIDPVNITIDSTKASAIQTALGSGNVTVTTANGASWASETNGTGTDAGNISVDAAINWSANKLTLHADNNITVNAALTATSTAGLALEYGQGTVASGNSSTYSINAPVNLTSTGSFSTKLGSDGTAVNYTIIDSLGAAGGTTGTDLQGMSGNLAGNYVLGANIDASDTVNWNSGAGFAPIGTVGNSFTGKFDGLGHTITGLTINRNAFDYIGLFGYASGATFRNIGLIGGSVTGFDFVGGLVGWNAASSTISNAYATGNVTGRTQVGGLVGHNEGNSITNAYATGAVTANGGLGGGLVGYHLGGGTIKNAYATGSVASGSSIVGGLVGGVSSSTIINAYATGKVTGSSDVGGLVGYGFGATITNGYWDTETTGQATSAGGTGLTTAQALTQSSYLFDFGMSDEWLMVDGSTRPMLRSEYSTTISNTHQLQLMAMDLTASYTLANNLDFGTTFTDASNADVWATSTPDGVITGAGFNPIGDVTTKFTGNFDGLGYTITGLTINRPLTDVVGLFGIAVGGTISNIGVIDARVIGKDYVGGLMGANAGTINNAWASVAMSANSIVGGLVGLNNSGASIDNSFATGNIEGVDMVGGLVGASNATIDNSYSGTNVAGITNIGGLVGATASQNATIDNSYATGVVVGVDYVGGLVGARLSGTEAEITNTYATGQVIHLSGTSTNFGGLLGGGSSVDITNSFYNSQTTGQSDTGKGTGLTTVQMQNPFTFIDAGWNFASVWGKSSAAENGGYMMLRGVGTSTLYDDYVRLSNTNTNKTYGDANPALTGITFSGVGTSNVTLGWNSAITTTTNAGSYAYGASVLDATTTSANGVYVDYGMGALTIDKRTISAVTGITAADKTYDGNTTATLDTDSAAFTNMVTGDSLSIASSSGAFADKNAGSNKTVAITGLTLGGTDAGNYTLATTTASDTADIAKASISSVTGITAADKTYDGNTTATLDTDSAAFTNMVTGDSLSVASSSGAFADKNAGSNKTVTITGLTLGGTDAGNYTLATTTASDTADIAKASISSVTGITAADKTYDGSTAATLDTASAAFTNMVTGDSLSVASSSGAFADKNAGSNKTVTITGLTLGGTDAGNYTLATTTASDTADIAKASISSVTGITAADKTYDGNTTATLDTASAAFTNMVTGDSLSVASSSGAFADKNAGSNKTVTITGLTLGGTDAGNYTLATTTASDTADIAKASISSVTGITAADKTYDGNTTATLDTDSAAFTNMVTGDSLSVASSSGAFADKNAGSNKTVTITGLTLGGTDAGNYTLATTTASDTADIAKATLSVTANDASKTYDGLAYSGGNDVAYTGFVNSETNSVLTGTLAYGGTAQGAVDAGNYRLIASGLLSDNYDIAYNAGTLTVNPQSQQAVSAPVNNETKQAISVVSNLPVRFFSQDFNGDIEAQQGNDNGNSTENGNAGSQQEFSNASFGTDFTGDFRSGVFSVADGIRISSSELSGEEE